MPSVARTLSRPLSRLLVAVLLATGLLTAAGPASQAATPPLSICYQAWVQGLGWSGTKCNGTNAGTTGQARRIESVRVQITGTSSHYCLSGHIQNTGDLLGPCVSPGSWATFGTAGSGRRLERMTLSWYTSGPRLCGYGHVQRLGWFYNDDSDGSVWLGTEGYSLRLEAIRLYVGSACL